MKLLPIPSIYMQRSHLPNLWDILALTLLMGLLGWLAWCGAQMTTPYQLGQNLPLSLDPRFLPGYAAQTVMRMFIALFFSLVFTLSIGSFAAKNPQVGKLIIPCIDVLQSVPVLGFLSLTVTGFIRLFPGSRIGPECAAIFAIFTAQVWNMILSFYQSIRAVPLELTEATTLFQLSAWQRFWRLEVPFALPALLWNTMLSMSGSWVFLVASESISLANQTIHLPGIGSYLGLAISHGSLTAVVWAVMAMLFVILIYDQLFFRPLITWSYKFNNNHPSLESTSRTWVMVILQRTRILQYLHYLLRNFTEFFLNKSFKLFQKNSFKVPPFYQAINSYFLLTIRVLSLTIGIYFIYSTVYFAHSYIDWKEAWYALILGAITAIRVISAVFIASCIWIPAGVWIGLRPQLTSIIQPMVQFLAAFPANVLFPLVVIILLKFQWSSEVGVLPLMLLSTQWYVLFNVIAGMGAIPQELYQFAQNFNLKGWLWWRKLILPAIFPYLVTGIMTAVGTAWNVSVVAEVIEWGSTTLSVQGLGAYIYQASESGNFTRLAMGITAMSLWVLIMNYCLWQPLYRLAQSKYRLD